MKKLMNKAFDTIIFVALLIVPLSILMCIFVYFYTKDQQIVEENLYNRLAEFEHKISDYQRDYEEALDWYTNKLNKVIK